MNITDFSINNFEFESKDYNIKSANEPEPYKNDAQMLSSLISFSNELERTSGAENQKNLFIQFKKKLFKTSETQSNYLLDLLTKNKWNDAELLSLFIAIGYALGSHRVLSLFTMLDYAKKGILDTEEVINLLSLKKSALFTHNYIETSFPVSDFVATRGFKNLIFSMGRNEKEEEKKPFPKLTSALKSINSIYEELSKYVIGQEQAKKVLASALFEHILNISLKEEKNIHLAKKNVLLFGPTGCGKTYLCQTLAKIAGIPMITIDASQYTAAGYRGNDVENIILNLAYMTNSQKKDEIPLSIVFIDEFDKIKFSPDSNSFDMKRQVQDGLLKMLESDIYRGTSFWFDISKVLFVVAGAFSGLEEEDQKQIGFVNGEKGFQLTQNAMKKIADYGFMPELLGRLPFYAKLDGLGKEEMLSILKTSKDSPLLQYSALFKNFGQELDISEETLENLVQKALINGTGARALNTVVGEYIQSKLYNIELPLDENKA